VATTWCDVLRRACSIGELPGNVEPQEAGSLGLVAPRPANAALTSAYLPHQGIEPLPSLDAAIAELLGAVAG
jgi:dTDP-4-dehydrorhamnose reductase